MIAQLLLSLGVGLFAAGTWYLRQLGMELDRRIEEHRRKAKWIEVI